MLRKASTSSRRALLAKMQSRVPVTSRRSSMVSKVGWDVPSKVPATSRTSMGSMSNMVSIPGWDEMISNDLETLAMQKNTPVIPGSIADYFDPNRVGRLNTEHLRSSLRSMGFKADADDVDHVMKKFGDGETVETAALVSALEREASEEISLATVKKFWELADADGSGHIPTCELRMIFTRLGRCVTDEEMNCIMQIYDIDGDGTVSFQEFTEMIKDIGFKVVDVAVPDKAGGKTGRDKTVPEEGTVSLNDPVVLDALRPLCGSNGQLNLEDLKKALSFVQPKGAPKPSPEDDPTLHWEKGRPKRGLGSVIRKVNHIAILVSDVGRSAAFYSEVLGLQQIRRPDFDRHGAWFTMGNTELHLIKGQPLVHSGEDLIVGHISIETDEIDRVAGLLEGMGIPFRQNVSVPKGKVEAGTGTNESNDGPNIVKQYFIRDPDGYYIEVCNCDILTKYCLDGMDDDIGYGEVEAFSLAEAAKFVRMGLLLQHKATKQDSDMAKLTQKLHGKSLRAIADSVRPAGLMPAEEVDVEKLQKLLVRRTVYTDVVQGYAPEDILEILVLAGNHVPTAMHIMEIASGGSVVAQPPAFFEQATDKVLPPTFKLEKKRLNNH